MCVDTLGPRAAQAGACGVTCPDAFTHSPAHSHPPRTARSPGRAGSGCQRRRRPTGNGRRRHNFSGRRGHLGQGGSRNWKKCNHGGPHLVQGNTGHYRSGGTGRGAGAFLGRHCHVGCPQTPGRSGLCLKESVSWLVRSLIQVLTRPDPA